jgi:D-methionine transport system substrate-binding protein
MTRPIARRAVLSTAALLPLFSIVRPARAATSIRLGTMAGESETVFQAAADVAKSRGVDVKIIGFNDYVLPNAALDHDELDANAFQHQPYLDDQIKSRGYHLVPVGFTYLAPIGVYSHKVRSLDALPQGARVGVPNDPTNGGRGLLLLQTLGLIKLREGAGLTATARDIADNPRGLKIVELDAGIIARSLEDLTAAVINTNWAVTAGLDIPHDRIAIEPTENNPYRNIVAVRKGRENEPWVKILVESIHSDHFRDVLQATWKGYVVPAF